MNAAKAAAKGELRVFLTVESLEPQFAAYMGTPTRARGYPPYAGQHALIIEVAPGLMIERVMDLALKADPELEPGILFVERQFGILEIHGSDKERLLAGGRAVLKGLGLTEGDQLAPRILFTDVIENIADQHAVIINRNRQASMVMPGETLLVCEMVPALYAAIAANVAEKAAPALTLVDVQMIGAAAGSICPARQQMSKGGLQRLSAFWQESKDERPDGDVMTDFDSLPHEEQLPILLELANKALKRYDLPSDSQAEMVNLSENATYKVTAPDGRKWALRVHREGYHSRQAIASELAWEIDLRQTGVVTTPNPIKGKDGEIIQEVTHPRMGRPRNVVLFDWETGAEPGIGEDLLEPFEVLGEITAHMHIHARQWKRPSWFTRLTWDFDTALGEQKPHWGRWRA